MLADKGNASRITSSPSLKIAKFLLAGWRLSHPKELPGDLPVPLECHTLTMNTIVLQLTDAVADISILQCSAQFRILIINANFVADNAYHALASSATAKPTFNVEEEVVVIRNGWTPKKEKKDITNFQIGAGLYAVGRPVQKRNEEDGQISTNQSLPLERGALFNRFFGKPAHGPPHVAGGASGPIGGCRDESRTDNPDLDLRHVFDRNNRKTDLI